MLTFLAVAQAADGKGDLTGLILLVVAVLFLGSGAKAATSNRSSGPSQPKESDDWVPIRLRDSSGRVTTYETPRSSLRAQGAPGTRSGGGPIKPGEMRLG